MAIEFEITVEEDILHVMTSGYDESIEEVMSYGTTVMNAAMDNNCTQVLADEVDLQYRLSTIDTFKLAEYYATTFRKIMKVAVITSQENMKDAKFWETAVRNRGLNYCVFSSEAEARDWLEDS